MVKRGSPNRFSEVSTPRMPYWLAASANGTSLSMSLSTPRNLRPKRNSLMTFGLKTCVWEITRWLPPLSSRARSLPTPPRARPGRGAPRTWSKVYWL